MTNITQITQNWGTFMTIFEPDNGSGTAQKVAFSTWVNGQNKRYAYVAWDQDVTPTASNNATASFGNIVQAANYDGTAAIWGPNDKAAFICGAAASIDFNATNGRITFAFRGQDGLTADVTNATVASNLIANGYNFYGAYATANQQFLEFQPGQVSGQFDWLDSYINQIYLNNQLQLALMELLQNTNSIPYETGGYSLIRAACADPINQALNFGSIRAGLRFPRNRRHRSIRRLVSRLAIRCNCRAGTCRLMTQRRRSGRRVNLRLSCFGIWTDKAFSALCLQALWLSKVGKTWLLLLRPMRSSR